MNKEELDQEQQKSQENDLLSQSLQPYQPVLSIESDMPDIKQDDGHLEMNKKDLLKQFTILFTIVLCIIFERVIYQFVVEEENAFIITCQDAFNLVKLKITPLGEMAYFDGNIIFDIAGSIHRNGINIMFFTNFFLTLYVGFDALLAVKIMYMSYTSVFLISYLQLVYSNPRPFWLKEEIVTSLCLPSYANPSSFFCQIGFTLFYTIYCYRIKNHTRSFKTYDVNFEKKVKIIQSILFLFLVIYSFLLFLMALQYIINTLLGSLYALIFYVFCVTFENQISNMVKHATIMNIDSKKYVMYISFILLISETIAVMSFSDEMEVIDINWTQNYMNCLYTTNQVAYEVPSQLLMGAKFTFEKTSIIFALIGALFGVSHSFRHIKTLEWYKGTVRKRIARVIVANICTIPGWIFASYLNEISLNHKIYEWGLSFFLMESVFFTMFYFMLFAWLPLRVFRYLKLNALSSTSYVVVNLQEQE